MIIEEPFQGTPLFEKIGGPFDDYADDRVELSTIRKPAERMPKDVFCIPALMVPGVVILLQRRRKTTGRIPGGV